MAQSTIKVPNYINNGLIAGKTVINSSVTIKGTTINEPTIRFGIKDNASINTQETPRVEIRRGGASGAYCLALAYYNSSGSSQLHTILDDNGNYIPEYVTSGTLSILSSRVTHSETVLQKCGKLVILSDKFTPSSNINAYTKFLQTAGGYRPNKTVNFSCVGPDGSSPRRLYIETDGGIGCRENLISGTEYVMYVSYFIP